MGRATTFPRAALEPIVPTVGSGPPGSVSAPTDRSRLEFGRSAATVPRTRREFEAARLRALVGRAAGKRPGSTAAEAGTPVRCPRCNTTNDHAARFCDRCGRRLGSSSAPVAGFTAAVQAAMARDLKDSAARLAAREGITEAEALHRVGTTSRTRGLRRRSEP